VSDLVAAGAGQEQEANGQYHEGLCRLLVAEGGQAVPHRLGGIALRTRQHRAGSHEINGKNGTNRPAPVL
jgi:hypothetical protein